MPLTPKNKIVFGLLACAVAAFSTDRLTRPADNARASAAAVSPSQLLVPENERAVPTLKSRPVDEVTTAQLLRTAARVHGWKLPDRESSTDRSSLASPLRSSMTASLFLQSHHLTGVVNSAAHGYAMVDGQVCTIGKSLNGFTLTSISMRSATFRNGNEKAVLTIAGSDGRPASGVR